MILRRWGTLVQCRVTWPQVAILRIYICSDDRTKMWWRWLCVCVCVPTCVYLCGFNLPRPRFPRVSVTYCFYEAASSSALLFFFLEFILCLEHRAAVFSTVKIDFFLMKCGGEGCFEEVFDGRAWREELGIHLPCHTSPSQDKQVGYAKATVF